MHVPSTFRIAPTSRLNLALKRASLFGRAPVVHDLEVAFTIWGFLGAAPPELVALRRPLFDFASRFVPDLSVVTARELVPGTSVEPVATIDLSASAMGRAA